MSRPFTDRPVPVFLSETGRRALGIVREVYDELPSQAINRALLLTAAAIIHARLDAAWRESESVAAPPSDPV